MAQANNVDLAALRGTGPDGAVGKADVEAALAAVRTAPHPRALLPCARCSRSHTGTPRLPKATRCRRYNAMRRTIAKRLTESKQNIPHFYVTAEIDIEAMFALREQVNSPRVETATKSRSTTSGQAVAVALGENPVVNSQFLDNKRILKKAINIGHRGLH
jgi:pyruvate dehydrogenase E2 component (dihydrolipoamide acetyltransferase)